MAKTSVAAKLKAFQAKTQDVIEQEEMKHIETMTLEELSKETIDFGKSKLGQTYTMAFSDQGWTSWFVSHYENSGKKAHRKYIRFVELMLETEPTPPVDKNKDKSKMKGYPAKAKAAASAPEVDQTWEQVKPVDETSESDLSVDFKVSHLEEEVVYMRQESKQLNTRMIAMEHTMNEIVQHLRKMQVKTENWEIWGQTKLILCWHR